MPNQTGGDAFSGLPPTERGLLEQAANAQTFGQPTTTIAAIASSGPAHKPEVPDFYEDPKMLNRGRHGY